MNGFQEGIELRLGDITRQGDVEAIVTAANEGLRGGGGVDGAVHRAAGKRLLEACRRIGRCPTGSAVVTPAFDLEGEGIRFVIHAVGPVWRGGRHDEDALLTAAYTKSIELADAHAVRALAFPAIGTGAYGFPVERAAPLAIRASLDGLRSANHIERIVHVLYDEATLEVFRYALEREKSRGTAA